MLWDIWLYRRDLLLLKIKTKYSELWRIVGESFAIVHEKILHATENKVRWSSCSKNP